MRQKGDNYKALEARRGAVREYVASHTKPGRRIKAEAVRKWLNEKGYRRLALSTIREDLKEAFSGDTFVRDLAAATYSNYMRRIVETHEYIIDRAIDISGQKWERTKAEIREVTNKAGETIITKTSSKQPDDVYVQMRALEIARSANSDLATILNGDQMKVSTATWVAQRKRDRHELEILRARLADADSKGAPVQ